MNPLNAKLNAYQLLIDTETQNDTPIDELIDTLRADSTWLGEALFALYAQAMESAQTQSEDADADDDKNSLRDFDFVGATPLARIAWVSDVSEVVEERIDALLDSDDPTLPNTLIDTLPRAHVGWTHRRIIDALNADATRIGAAWLVAQGAPEALDDWLLDCELIEDALDGFRALALSDTDMPAADWRAFSQWRGALNTAYMETKDPQIRAEFEAAQARVTGALATLDLATWARLALGGESDAAWVNHPEVVADFLHAHGTTSWLGVLSMLEAAEDPALGFASLLGVAAASGRNAMPLGSDPLSDDAAHELIELLQLPADAPATEWEPTAARLGLASALALAGADDAAPDDGLGLLLVQVAAHERLLHHGYHSPGLSGLPHSATDPGDVSIEASFELLEEVQKDTVGLDAIAPDMTAMILRNCQDLHQKLDKKPEHFEALSNAWADAFADSPSPALRLSSRGLRARLNADQTAHEREILAHAPDLAAALILSQQHLAEPRVIATLAHHADAPNLLALACGKRLAEIGTRNTPEALGALEALAKLWANADCLRAPFFAQCLQDAVDANNHSTAQATT